MLVVDAAVAAGDEEEQLVLMTFAEGPLGDADDGSLSELTIMASLSKGIVVCTSLRWWWDIA